MERDSLSHRTTLICGKGPIDCPGDQALRGITGNFKIRKDMYMDLFEGLTPLSGMFFPSSSQDFLSFRKTMFKTQGVHLNVC